MLAALFLMAQTPQPPVEECPLRIGAEARDRCELERSMRFEPAPDCASPDTQLAMNICTGRDYLRADIVLNQTWDKVAARYKGDDVFHAILQAQRSWLTYRDRQCTVWAKLYEGGSIVPSAVQSCRAELTKTRIATLEQLMIER